MLVKRRHAVAVGDVFFDRLSPPLGVSPLGLEALLFLEERQIALNCLYVITVNDLAK